MFFLLVACGLSLVACGWPSRAARAFVSSKDAQCLLYAQQVPRGFRPEASYYCTWTGSTRCLPLQVGIFLDHHGNVANNVAPVAPVGRQLVLN